MFFLARRRLSRPSLAGFGLPFLDRAKTLLFISYPWDTVILKGIEIYPALRTERKKIVPAGSSHLKIRLTCS
jgi:hypothetical protein